MSIKKVKTGKYSGKFQVRIQPRDKVTGKRLNIPAEYVGLKRLNAQCGTNTNQDMIMEQQKSFFQFALKGSLKRNTQKADGKRKPIKIGNIPVGFLNNIFRTSK